MSEAIERSVEEGELEDGELDDEGDEPDVPLPEKSNDDNFIPQSN